MWQRKNAPIAFPLLHIENPGNAPVADMSEFEPNTNNVILNRVTPFEAHRLYLSLS